MDYWKECLAEAADEFGVALTEEQLVGIARIIEGAHENYGQATGRDVWDDNWRAAENTRLKSEGAEAVLKHVEACVATIDGGPSRVFDAMSHNQKIAMHELFQTRRFVHKSGAVRVLR